MKKCWYVWKRLDGRAMMIAPNKGTRTRQNAMAAAADYAKWLGRRNVVACCSGNAEYVWKTYFKEEDAK